MNKLERFAAAMANKDSEKIRAAKIRIGECPVCKKDVCAIKYDAKGKQISNDCSCQKNEGNVKKILKPS